MALPSQSVNINIAPLEPLLLCGIARLSMPCSRILSIQFQRPSGLILLKRVKGSAGMRSVPRKMTLRCRASRSNVDDVNSYPAKVVNVPGIYASSAASIVFDQADLLTLLTTLLSIVPSRSPPTTSLTKLPNILLRLAKSKRLPSTDSLIL